jgi:ribosomal protein S18 acetylase RimI-like enzyme
VRWELNPRGTDHLRLVAARAGSGSVEVGLYLAAVAEAAIDIYCDAFVARQRHELDGEPVVLVAPGVRGVALIRLLVSDDSGYGRLVEEVERAGRGVVYVFERASRCHEFLRGQPGWSAGRSELAMVLRDVQAAAGAALPDGLLLRPVKRVASDAPDGVSLQDAVAAAIASDLGITESADHVAGYLRGLPSSVRLLAAVDDSEVVRATSACHVFGEYAQVFFVNTEPAWRRRGIGQAMTLEALRAAAFLGVRRAFLHATDDGASMYERLGFEAVGLLTRYSC